MKDDNSPPQSAEGGRTTGVKCVTPRKGGGYKYISTEEVVAKYNKLHDCNKFLEEQYWYARKELAFYRCHMGMIKEFAKYPSNADEITPLSNKELNNKGKVVRIRKKKGTLY